MPKHNNAIQRPHMRKDWASLVRTFFNQPAQKLKRLNKRRQKATDIYPRPLRSLKPIVHKPTQRYSGQTRLGRGFTRAELKAVKLNILFAQSIGIAVDTRRQNKSTKILETNVKRLSDYLEKLILCPKKAGQPKKGNNGVVSDATDCTNVVQSTEKNVLGKPTVNLREKSGKITKEMNEFRAYSQLRTERMNQKWQGKREKRQALEKKD